MSLKNDEEDRAIWLADLGKRVSKLAQTAFDRLTPREQEIVRKRFEQIDRRERS